MMCLPASIALAFPPAPAGPPAVNFVAATGSTTLTSASSISSPSTPSGVSTGDALYAFVFCKKNGAQPVLTPPSGWTLVDSLNVNDFGDNGKFFIYSKNSPGSGDSSQSLTWTQDTTNVLGLGYVLARSTTGSITQAAATMAGGLAFGTDPVVPTLTATEDGELFILAAALAVANNTTSWAAPSGATLRSPASQSDNFIAFATQVRDTGQSNSSPFDVTSPGFSGNFSIAIRLQVT